MKRIVMRKDANQRAWSSIERVSWRDELQPIAPVAAGAALLGY